MQFFQLGENDQLKARVYFHLVDATDGITPETGEAGGRAKISINGNAPSNSVNTLVAVDTTNQPGTYYLILSPSELNTPGFLSVRYKSANTAEFVTIAQIVAFDPYSKRYGDESLAVAVDVDYKRVRKIIQEELGTLPKAEAKETDLSPLTQAVSEVQRSIRQLKFPDFPTIPTTDLTPALQAIQAIKIPEANLDLSPVMNALKAVDLNQLNTQTEIVIAQLEEIQPLLERIKDFFAKDIEDIKSEILSIRKEIKRIPMIVMSKGEDV